MALVLYTEYYKGNIPERIQRICDTFDPATYSTCAAEVITNSRENIRGEDELYLQRQMERWSFWTMIVTALGIVGVAISLYAAQVQARAAVDSLLAIRKQISAYIKVEATGKLIIEENNNNHDNIVIKSELYFTNVSDTEARNVEIFAQFYTISMAHSSDDEKAKRHNLEQRYADLKARQPGSLDMSKGYRHPRKFENTVLTKLEEQAVINGEKHFALIGWIFFTDAFNKDHLIEFIARYRHNEPGNASQREVT